MKFKCIAFFLLCFSTFSFAQQHIYKEFGINEGLPSLEVHELFQDKDGLIWFATDRGMAHYNGYEIQKDNLHKSVSNAVVLDVFPQPNGNIYAATYTNELLFRSEVSEGFQPYKYNHILKEILKFKNHIICVYEDADENVHIACEFKCEEVIISKEGKILQHFTTNLPALDEYELWMYLKKKNDSIVFFSYAIDSLIKEKNAVKVKIKLGIQNEAILLKENNHIVCTDGQKINILDGTGTVIKTIENDKMPIALKALTSTTFFVGYDFGGGVFMDINGTVKNRFFPDESVSDLLIDHEGSYWFSTLHSGVFYVKEPYIKTFKTGITSPAKTLAKTKANELYIGYRSGEVLQLDSNRNITSETGKSNSAGIIEYNTDKNLLYVKSGDVFYSKNDAGMRSSFSDSISLSFYTKMTEPLGNKIIVSCQNGFRVIENNVPTHFDISTRANDVAFWNDTYYVGTPSGAFTVKNGQTRALSEMNPIFNHRVDDIDVNAARNEIYFATLGSGVIVYNLKTEEVRVIKVAEGLSSNNINEICIENKDEIWVCTSSGLNKIRFTSENDFHISGKGTNGLLNDAINDVEVINDTVWIASKKGLMYAPKHLFNTNITSNNYHLKVKSVLVNDSLILKEKLKSLAHTENRIDFFVEGIHFKAPNELQYTYMLEGLDTKWHQTKNRRISYSALPYGNYTFKVAATTFQNEAQRACIEIPIQIHAPFWKRTWFIVSVIVGIVLLIYLFFKYRILSYNRHIIRELLRLLIKKIKKKELYFSFKEAGKEIRIKTDTILYVKSAGNYVEVVTEQKNYTIRTKIGEFINLMPDPLEYLRIHRSYIVRIDKVAEKNSKEVRVNGQKIPVSNSYASEIQKLIF